MNWLKTKRHYADFRTGLPIIAPLLSISNFILLAYNFTALKDMVSIEIFGVGFAIIFVTSMVLIGNFYRKKQQPIDFGLQFERNRKNAMMFRLLLENSASHFISTDPRFKEINETVEYLI